MDRWARNIGTCFKHVHGTWLKVNYLPWGCALRGVLPLHSDGVQGGCCSLCSPRCSGGESALLAVLSTLVGPSAAHPLLLSALFWSLDGPWCFLLLLCCDRGRWHKFMGGDGAWPCSKWPGSFLHMERFWCCLGQPVGFADCLWVSWSCALYLFTHVNMYSRVCLTGLWWLYLYYKLIDCGNLEGLSVPLFL